MGKDKYILIFAVIALILLGFSYASGLPKLLADSLFSNPCNIIFIEDECKVISASDRITAEIYFDRDKSGKISDRSTINFATRNAYAGGTVDYIITAQNIGEIPVSIDEYKLKIYEKEDSIADLIYFSGNVKVYHGNNSYYDVLGSFEKVELRKLDRMLTSIMKYRKIDINEKFTLEITLEFDNDRNKFLGKTGVAYELQPSFIQYFPEKEKPRTE